MFRLLTQKLQNLDIRCIKSISNKYSSKAEAIVLPEYADVVIIGGGSAGCNALYHLGKRGVKAVLLEKSKLSSGTTWHTAGLVWCLRGPSDVEVELLKITRRVLTSLEDETGANSGYINNGGIYIAHNMARMGEYKRLVNASKAFGLDTYLISPKEAKDLFPLLDDSSFQGAVHSPADGTVDPAMLLHALKISAKNHNCEVFENSPVTKILTVENGVGCKKISAVQTPHGIIKTNCVLNAAGAWSRNIAKMVGLDIPLIAMKHAYIVTDHIQEIYGHPNVRAPDLNLYFKIQGGAMSIGGYEHNPIILQSVPMDFAFSLYEMDWNVFDIHMKSMVQMMPKLSTTGIKTTVCGPESFTPDHRPIMGEDPRCTGLFYSCGYNSAGMMLGGGCGEQIAQWIVNGRPDLHMFNYDIRRYIPEQRTNSIWVNERTHEAYDKNYNTVFRHEQPLAGRNLKVDPFHENLLKEGAFMEECQGWERVGWFLPDKKILRIATYDYGGAYGLEKNEKDEYRAILEREYSFDFPHNHDVIKKESLSCRENVAMFNLSNSGKFYLCGPESKLQEAVDYIFTSSPKLDSNKMINTYALNHNGGVEACCTVTALNPGSSSVIDPIFKGKALYIVADGASSYHTWVHINDIVRKNNFQVTLHDVTEQIGILSIQGPQSIKILQMLLEKDCSDKTPIEFSTARLMSIQGELVRVCRVSSVGEFGFELHIPKESCEKMYKLVMDYGKQFNMKLAGFRALSSLACEKGYHEWNADLRIDDNPLEAGLDVPCGTNDIRYLGKEAVERCMKNGVKRKRVHVHVKDKIPIWGLETIYRNQELVGYLRRTAYSYYFDKSIGQGYIQHPSGESITEEFLKSGNYEIGIMGDKYPAELYVQSPFDPQDKRLLGIYN